MSDNECPCGSNQSLAVCCELYISGQKPAPSAEALMRSRYTAFTQKNMDYIRDTLDPQALGDYDDQANRAWAEAAKFSKLEILKSIEEGNKASIEFIATYSVDNEEHKHHELSKFRKKGNQWFFREGRIREKV